MFTIESSLVHHEQESCNVVHQLRSGEGSLLIEQAAKLVGSEFGNGFLRTKVPVGHGPFRKR
jgi:hypothetical protein